MDKPYDKEEFFSSFGVRDLHEHLRNSNESSFATVTTDLETGEIRTLMIKAEKTTSGFDVAFTYSHHHNTGHNESIPFLHLSCAEDDNTIAITKAEVDGQKLDLSDHKNHVSLPRITKPLSEAIISKNEWVNPVQLISDAGYGNGFGKRAWPGLYASGDVKTTVGKTINSDTKPVYPALFLHAILGVGPHKYVKDNTQSRVLTLFGRGEEHQNSMFKYRYKRGKNPNHLNITGTVTVQGDDSKKEEELYKIEVRPNKSNPKREASIKSLHYMGVKIDLRDSRAVGSVMKAVRNINRMIRAGDRALIDDLKKPPHDRRFMLPTDINLYTGIYPHLNEKHKIPKQGIMTFSAIGGNNQTPYVSEADQNIGANQYIIGYEFLNDEGEKKNASLMIDAGVLFHDIFDVAFFNAGRYLKHKHDKAHEPEEPVGALLFTHRHKDHLGQLAYLVKKGYELPPLIMNEMTMLQLKRDMSELDIESSIKEEILEKCYPINLLTGINPQDPDAITETEIAGTKIEQWTEVQPGEKMGSYEHFPRLRINDVFEVRVGPMPHSDPGLMYDIITEAGSHRHTGDYKWDDSIQLGIPPLHIWMRGHEPDSMSADSTGAIRPGENTLEAEVMQDIVKTVKDHADSRFVFPMLGSNITRLGTLIAALGQTDRKTLVIDGKAVEDLVRDADKVYDLKKWAKDFHGVDILIQSQKTKVEPLLSDPARGGEYALLVTGTQDEAFSSLNRAARDALPPHRWNIRSNDIIAPLQGVIPTGDNYFRRMALKDYVKMFHGAHVILPEAVNKEADKMEDFAEKTTYGPPLIRHSSGHNNAEGIERGIIESGTPFILPVHGGPQQLQKHLEIADKVGANTAVVTGSMEMRIEKGKKVSFFRTVPSEFIGVTNHTPSRDKFYLKGRFSTSVMPIKPVSTSLVAQLVDTFEDTARSIAGVDSDFEMGRSLPVSLSRSFNADNLQGFLKQHIDFGIDKYKGGVFKDKGIHAIGAADTETGGLSPMRHLMREFALTIKDVETRETIDNVQLFQQIPDYRMPSPIAMLVTNTHPDDLEEGLPAAHFVDEMNTALTSVKKHSHALAEKKSEEGKVSRHDIKALIVWHNERFDSKFIAKESARNLDTNTRLHQTYKTVSIDTRAISRALAAYAPGEYKVAMKPDANFMDHTLESLSRENGLDYDEKKAHGGQYDTNLCMDLFWKQYDIAPDLVEQMVINADSSTSHLLNDMMGMDMGFNGPHPIFSYVSPAAKRPKAQMGAFIGTMDSERYAVVFNLKYDPNDYLHLPASKIADMLADYDNDVFEVLDLRQNPIVAPARYGLRVKANGTVPKETLDRRAGVIKRHLNYVDPQNEWKTIAQKVAGAWENDRDLRILKGRIAHNQKDGDEPKYYNDYRRPDEYPDLERQLDSGGGRAARPEHGAQNLLRMRAKVGMNSAYRHVTKILRDYVESVRADDVESANAFYDDLLEERDILEDTMDTINQVQYDIDPEHMFAPDIERTEAMRDFLAYQHYLEAKTEVDLLQNDPEAYARFIDDDPKKKKLFKAIKTWVEEHGDAAILSERTKLFMNPIRKYSRAGQEHNDKDKPLEELNPVV